LLGLIQDYMKTEELNLSLTYGVSEDGTAKYEGHLYDKGLKREFTLTLGRVEVEELFTTSVSLLCPHCNSIQGPFNRPPRGHCLICSDCDKEYQVSADAWIAT